MLQSRFSESNAPVQGLGSLRPSIRAVEARPGKSSLGEKLKELARSIPVVAAALLAVTAGVLKIYDPSLLTEWLRRGEDQIFEALVLFLIALVSTELTIERFVVFPKLNTIAELRELTRDAVEKTRNQLELIQTQLANDLGLLTATLQTSDNDLVFSTLAFKYIRGRVASVRSTRCLEVKPVDAYRLWRDCVQDAKQVCAVSFAVDSWGARNKFSAEHCQGALVAEHGKGAVKRIFITDPQEPAEVTDDIRTEMIRQRKFADEIYMMSIDQFRKIRGLDDLRSRLQLTFELNDFVLFQSGSSALMYVLCLDENRRTQCARIMLLDGEVQRIAGNVFCDALHVAKQSPH